MPGPDLQLICDVAIEAGEIARRHLQGTPESWDKGSGQGPVTQADLDIDRMMHAVLLKNRPDYGWLSEEREDDQKRTTANRSFIVDPIDGTRAFIAGQPTFAHSIGISEDGEIIGGVVHLPMMNRTYTAWRDEGAWCGDQRLSVSSCTEENDARVLAAKPQFQPDRWPGGVPPSQRHFRPSLAFRLCLVAAGEFDAMITLRKAWEWDIAAGDILCREAGARVTDRKGALPTYNKPKPQHDGVICAGPDLHTQFMARL